MKIPGLFLLLLTPFFFEASGVKAFMVAVPGSPLSLGALGMLAFGIPVLLTNRLRSSRVLTGLLLIYLGSLVGAFFSSDVIGNVSAALGQCLLLIGVYGLAVEFSKQPKRLFWMLDLFMLGCWLYWFVYVCKVLPQIGGPTSYSRLWSLGKVLNHHIPGLLLSVSAIYVANRLMARSKFVSYAVLGLTILCCLVMDSRSNALFSMLGLLWTIFQHRKLSLRFLLVTAIALYGLFYVSTALFESFDFMKKRFDVHDREYQRSTLQSRLYFYESFFVELARSPLGRGLENTKIEHEYRMMLLHNQFLTYVLAGGLVALLGVIMLLTATFKILFLHKNHFPDAATNPYIIPIKGTVVVLMATLTTIEFGGSVVYLTFALMAFLEIQYRVRADSERRMKRKLIGAFHTAP